ncbi:transcription factor ces-2-like [Ostrea edulis]|uniref:transcription factor ces-2-like n=1 Tax=Ostrea edulis TaxID=37623 RepID=UPI0024AEB384|nr:transcription factor ces-2-like [Ostrea edulis]
MSDNSRVKQVNDRNLHDSRVSTTQALGSVLGVTSQAEALDFPIFSFDENIFPGSPCPQENLMESFHLYDSEQYKKGQVTTITLDTSGQFDLDPLFENAVDIQQLLNNTTQVNDADLESIILGEKTADPVTVVPYIELQTTQASSLPALKEFDFMSSQEQITTTSEAGWPATTIKTEEFGTCDLDSLASSPPASEYDVTSSTLTPPTSPFEVVRGRPGRKPSAAGPLRPNRKKQPPKGTEEYLDKRSRNNIAVRKSRDKAKKKQQETESRMQELCLENENLQKKLDLLTKELNVLKSLFTNVGASLPSKFDEIMSR